VERMLKMGQYPIFISWDSTGVGNYFDHLVFLRRGSRFKYLGPLSSPFVWIEDTLRAISRIPASCTMEVRKLWAMPIGIHTDEEKAVDRSRAILCGQKEFDLRDDARRQGQEVSDYITALNPVKLVSSPFMDGLGAGAWQSMLRRTDFVLRRSDSF